jgi:hypothetical protein
MNLKKPMLLEVENHFFALVFPHFCESTVFKLAVFINLSTENEMGQTMIKLKIISAHNNFFVICWGNFKILISIFLNGFFCLIFRFFILLNVTSNYSDNREKCSKKVKILRFEREDRVTNEVKFITFL